MLDIEGKPAVTAYALQPDEGDQVAMPRLLRLIFPQEHRSVTISYNDVKLNEPVVCAFIPPKHAEVIRR